MVEISPMSFVKIIEIYRTKWAIKPIIAQLDLKHLSKKVDQKLYEKKQFQNSWRKTKATVASCPN